MAEDKWTHNGEATEIEPISVGRMIELLGDQDPETTLAFCLVSNRGWKIQSLGAGDALIGRTDDGFVFLPIEVPDDGDWEDWTEENKEESG